MENLYVKLAAYRKMETERLHLRPVTLEDAPAMFEYASDEAVTPILFQPIKVLKRRVIILPSFIYRARLEDGGSSSKKWKIYWDD